jgi:very-short-patch-repair endonuclease
MDFLLLLPRQARVVVEVDGRQHYANREGRADPQLYAAMMAADRDLKLAGYEVFRFGASELQGDAGKTLVRQFFARLFREHGVACVSV